MSWLLKGGLIVVIGAIGVGHVLNEWFFNVEPIVDWNACWSQKDCDGEDRGVRKAPWSVADSELHELKQRLRNRRPMKWLHGWEEDETYGINHEKLEALLDHWENKYDWRTHERELNAWDPHETTIDGLKIHFLHVRNKRAAKMTLLLLHGWPGSIYEFHALIPKLLQGNDELELIIPSLPGYGWSDGAGKPGLDMCAVAVIMSKLMNRLGKDNYYVQGGDWGSLVAHCLVQIVPEQQLLGTHINMPFVVYPWWSIPYTYLFVSDPMERKKLFPLTHVPLSLVETIPYFMQQMTRPHTIGIALEASPVATASWILDKFFLWMDPKSNATYDELLTNLMFYWLTSTQTSSVRLYKESFWSPSASASHNAKAVFMKPLSYKFGVSVFPHEILPPPIITIKNRYRNLVTLDIGKRGGHFAALENPEELASHILAFLSKLQMSSG